MTTAVSYPATSAPLSITGQIGTPNGSIPEGVEARTYEKRKYYEHALHLLPTDRPNPADNPSRNLAVAQPAMDATLRHIGMVGDTYTVLLSGDDTDGRYCLIDMLVPLGGGPAPHRHDFEESFTVLDGEIEVTFRGQKQTIRAGETVNIPANAPHFFTNASRLPARLLCICAPAGQEKFFEEIGVPLPSRTSKAPELDKAAQAAFMKKAKQLAPKYRTELLGP